MLPLFNGTLANQQRACHANQPAKLNFVNVITGSMHFPATWYRMMVRHGKYFESRCTFKQNFRGKKLISSIPFVKDKTIFFLNLLK
jgi:hypothetical protein